MSLTLDDLKELDSMLGCEKGGPDLASVMLAQHMTMLGLRYINNHVPQAKRSQAEIELYRSIEKFRP